VNHGDGVDPPRAQLARRLRELRGDVKQSQVAALLKVTVSAISNWENGVRLPQPGYLNAYARFSAIKDSRAGTKLRLLGDDELTDDERRSFEEIEHELRDLWAAASRPLVADLAGPRPSSDPLGDFWQFDDRAPLTIVCSELPASVRKNNPLASPSSPDYAKLSAYADLDALVELFGHARATNPATQVNYRLGAELTEDDYTTHLALLGGVDWNPATESILTRLDIPVRQVSGEHREQDAYFEVDDAGERLEFRPRLRETSAGLELWEDVALLYRGPNPINAKRTLSICNGIFGRGTYGAVRALTDARFRNRNQQYLEERFGAGDAWLILARVPVMGDRTLTPDLTQAITRLYEWPGPSTRSAGSSDR
jgi:transcriptional regulator with XRE-family HTH domain